MQKEVLGEGRKRKKLDKELGRKKEQKWEHERKKESKLEKKKLIKLNEKQWKCKSGLMRKWEQQSRF